MAWEPLPQRRVVLENASFVYAFGNTRQRSLLTDGGAEEHRALLLGFGDPRHVLATAAACGARAGLPRRLAFDLNDISPLNVARGVLLLHLASTIDPCKPDDLAFLWGASYCLRLSTAHSERLAAAVRELLAQPDALRAQAGDASTAAVLERVLRGWVEGAPRGVAAVEAERRRLLLARLSTKAGQRVSTDEQLRSLYGGQAEAALQHVLPWPRPSDCQGLGGTYPALAAECVEYFMTGTIYGTADSRSSAGWAVNPTLLQPGSRAWLLHYGALPFLPFMPLDLGRHAGLTAAPGPRALTRACVSELAALVRGWQACQRARVVQARFWCCDALALCAQLAAPAGMEAPEARGFDAVDASNLPDHVGTLNLLALAAPLLRRAPHARLWTTHMLWSGGGSGTLHEYLRTATGASDTRLLPTLLGLRLAPDPTYGLEQPISLRARYGMCDLQTVVAWAPAPLAPAAQPTLTDADGIAAALRAWGDLACACRAVPLKDRSGLDLATPLTLLHLVAGLGARVQHLLPPGTATWQQLADALAAACAVPEAFRMQLRALCCWALQPASGGGGGQPLLVRGRLPLSAAYRKMQEQGLTPLLRLHLVDTPRGAALPAMLAELLQLHEHASGAAASALLRHMHVVNVLAFEQASQEVAQVAFLLPPDHGLDLRAAVSLLHVSEGSVPLASLDIRPFERQPPAALAAGLRRLLERSATAAEAPGGAGSRGVSSAGVQLSSGLQLCRLAEHADRFELELAVDQGLGSSLGTKQGLALTFPDAPPGGGIGYRLEITLAQPARLHARLTLPWPVESATAAVRVHSRQARSTRTVTATLPKALMWLASPAGQPSLDVHGLPEWGTGQGAASELAMHMGLMFSHEESEQKQRSDERPASAALFQAKDSLQSMFALQHQHGMHMHIIRSTAAAPDGEPALTLFIHGGVRRLPDGRPVLHVSCVDHERALRLFPSMASRAAPVARFSNVIRKAGGMGQRNTMACTPAEIRLLRALLHHNAAMLRVPSWQSALLDLPSEWVASFIVPPYSDFVADPDQGMSLLRSMESQARQAAATRPSSAPGGGGSPAGGGGSAALEAGMRHKEAGNAAFKRRQYAAAAQQYSAGCAALAAAAGKPGAPGQRLRLDLANNLAQALIKQAEAEPAAEARLLEGAAMACDAVLAEEPGNNKARYRRALARHRQGQSGAAATDLAAITGEAADAMVAALRVEVAAALRR